MNRRALTVNRSPRRRPEPRPTCPSVHSRSSQRCVLDPGHRADHFAAGVSWANEEAAA